MVNLYPNFGNILSMANWYPNFEVYPIYGNFIPKFWIYAISLYPYFGYTLFWLLYTQIWGIVYCRHFVAKFWHTYYYLSPKIQGPTIPNRHTLYKILFRSVLITKHSILKGLNYGYILRNDAYFFMLSTSLNAFFVGSLPSPYHWLLVLF